MCTISGLSTDTEWLHVSPLKTSTPLASDAAAELELPDISFPCGGARRKTKASATQRKKPLLVSSSSSNTSNSSSSMTKTSFSSSGSTVELPISMTPPAKSKEHYPSDASTAAYDTSPPEEAPGAPGKVPARDEAAPSFGGVDKMSLEELQAEIDCKKKVLADIENIEKDIQYHPDM